MTMDDAEAREAARAATEDAPGNRLLERLADRLGAKAGVHAVFGEPIAQGDLTIISVARVRWGFGGGSGTAAGPESASGSGSGGGGGVTADPVGFVEIGPDGAVFRPIRDSMPSAGFVLVSALSVAILLRAVARLVRG
jgi:uncharacterized spore protein YtfJ